MPFFFVLFKLDATHWTHVRNQTPNDTGETNNTFEADDGLNACGRAAIANDQPGHYIAWDVAAVASEDITLQFTADATDIPLE